MLAVPPGGLNGIEGNVVPKLNPIMQALESLGTDVHAVCPLCAVVDPDPAHVCVWDGNGVTLPEAAELNCQVLESRLEEGYTAPDRRTLFRRLASKDRFLTQACPSVAKHTLQLGWLAGILTLRAWCSHNGNSNVARLQLEDPAGATRHTCAELSSMPRPTVTGALILLSAASLRRCGQTETRCAAQPRCETVTAAATLETAQFRRLSTSSVLDSLPLWLFLKHAPRRRAPAGLWALEPHWERIFELLGTRWIIIGGPNLMDSWSFRNDVKKVVLLPSFFFCAEPHHRYRRVFETWPRAVVSMYAPQNAPSFQAFRRMLACNI